MKKLFFILAVYGSLQAAGQNFKPDESFYASGFQSADSLGNHRAVVHVSEKCDRIRAEIPWRRRDQQVEEKGIVIIDATSGKPVHNFYRGRIDREAGELFFQPQTVPGDYYIYYLPYHSSGGPYPKVTYAQETSRPDVDWLARNAAAEKNIPEARFLRFESKTAFDSFYPMEIIATEKEKADLLARSGKQDYLLFPEDRNHPIKMFYDIPYRWTVEGAREDFFAEADQNEYFVFQIGLWALGKDMQGVKVNFSGLYGASDTIPASDFTCFNTEGTDWLQRKMQIDCTVPQGKIQPLWIGVQLPTGIRPGYYTGEVRVSGKNTSPRTIRLKFRISDRVLTDKGDGDIYRLSRLRWLNSELACNDEIVKPFLPLTLSDRTIGCLGRTVEIDKYGLPAAVNSYFTEEVTEIGKKALPVIHAPFSFLIEKNKKALPWNNESFRFLKKEKGKMSWESSNTAGDFSIRCQGAMEFDGFMEYKITLKAHETSTVSDIRLEIPLNGKVAEYWLGMGHPGSHIPRSYRWKWDVQKNQEGFWIGTVNAGLHCVFRDENYVRPLNTNFYHSKPLHIPECWNNGGKGGITFSRKGNTLLVKAYSGSRVFQKDEEMTFIFLVSVTPFKTLDTQKQWTDRYLHSYEPIDQVVAQGANTINIHHGTPINPHINYPFFRPDFMKAYIDEAHQKECKVKIYYTVRELANRAPELWALRSLGHEIFSEGKGNGYSWLQEHLDSDYIAAWFVEKYTDAAIVNSGVSRWHNFYVEGLNWLVKNVGIDGLYIDDLAFDRTTMKRIRKILDAGCPAPRIDLHSANQFNAKDGYINSACLYMEHMPYLDRLWLGEYFDYNAGPDYWLTEVSGIPFGMMGEMLQDCGNPWRGMIYGMTSRLHWEGCEVAQYLWKAWDDFGIKGSKMVGYWASDCPVKTGKKDILATCYVREGKTMIAIASWAPKDEEVQLHIDWERLGIQADQARLYAPEIPLYQSAQEFTPGRPVKIEKGKGYLLILE